MGLFVFLGAVIATFVSASSNQNGTGSTTLSITRPTGLANGDTLFAGLVFNIAAPTISVIPAGFVSTGITLTDATNLTYMIVYSKDITNAAGEPASYGWTFTSSKVAGGIIAVRGSTTSPVLAYSTQTTSDFWADINHARVGGAFIGFVGQSYGTTFSPPDTVNTENAAPSEAFDITSSGGGNPNTKVTLLGVYDMAPGRFGTTIKSGDWYATPSSTDTAPKSIGIYIASADSTAIATVSSPQPSYIYGYVPTPIQGSHLLAISGTLDMYSTQPSFIDGHYVIEGSTSAFMEAWDFFEPSLPAFIYAPFELEGNFGAHIESHESTEFGTTALIEGHDLAESTTTALVEGWDLFEASLPAYVEGYYAINGSQNIYTAAYDVVTDTQDLYMGSGSYADSSVPVFMYGLGLIDTDLSIFMAGSINVESAMDSYLAGEDSASLFLDSHTHGHEVAEGSQGTFIEPSPNILEATVQSLFINGVENINGSIGAFTYAPFIIESSLGAFTFANLGLGNHRAYVTAIQAVTQGFKQAYIQGISARIDTHICYISADVPRGNVSAIRFDKTKSQYARWLHRPAYNNISRATVNFWMRPLEIPDATRGGYFIKHYNGNSQTIGVWEGGTGLAKWHFGVNTGTWSAQDSVGTFTLNRWYMCTVRYDGTNCAFFVNGVFDSQFAKTGDMVWSDHPWYAGWHQGLYTTFDFADATVWDYALTDSEIAAMYHGPFVQSSQGAYITYVPALGTSELSVYAHIVSDLAPTNPSSATSTQMCVIPTAQVSDSQAAFIHAGQEHIINHDVEISIDNYFDINHDLIIRIGGQGGVMTRIQEADILYPITRLIYREVTPFPFIDMPGVGQVYQPAFINAGFKMDTHTGNTSDPTNPTGIKVQMAYIRSGTVIRRNMAAYIHGRFTSIERGKQCFLNGANTSELHAYIEGTQIRDTDYWIWCYIAAPISSLSDDAQNAYVTGWDVFTSNQMAYITTAREAESGMQAFINAPHVTPITDEQQYVYMFGAVLVERTQLAYMFGTYQQNPSHPAYITATSVANGTQLCFINSPSSVAGVQRLAFIYGAGPIENTQMCYLQSSINMEEGHDLFMPSHMPFESSRRAYVVNYPIFTIERPKLAYVSGPLDMEAGPKMCFIGSGTTEEVFKAYIFSVGTRTSTRYIYLVGAPVTGNRLCHLRA